MNQNVLIIRNILAFKYVADCYVLVNTFTINMLYCLVFVNSVVTLIAGTLCSIMYILI